MTVETQRLVPAPGLTQTQLVPQVPLLHGPAGQAPSDTQRLLVPEPSQRQPVPQATGFGTFGSSGSQFPDGQVPLDTHSRTGVVPPIRVRQVQLVPQNVSEGHGPAGQVTGAAVVVVVASGVVVVA